MMVTTLQVLAVALVAQVATATAVVELNDENWLETVHGKSVFIFFDEFENEECRALDDTWEKLAAEWAGHEVGLVGRVDCDSEESEILCEEYGIVSLPLLMFGDPHSPEFYEDHDRSYATLSAFAKKHISKPPCNLKNIDHCGATERKLLTELSQKPRQELEAMEEKAHEKVAEVELKFDAKIADIQAQYAQIVAEFNTELDQVRQDTNYKWIQQVLRHWDEKDEAEGEL
uniref:Thioredoxin domain-containing protein n=1 Tax=Amphora coffeiformis TaxID=265554 RepID=A0A7S3L0R3_9STRA